MSSATTALLSSRFTNIVPLPSATANSGFPPSGMLPTTVPAPASITLALSLPPLNTKTRLEAGSYSMASGFRAPSLIRPRTASVIKSNIVTEESRPLLVKPRLSSGARATPWTPGVSGISPRTLSVFTSTTWTLMPWVRKSRWFGASRVKASQPPSPPRRTRCATL